MIQFDLPKEQSSIIKVIGVGGGGSNAVNHMHAQVIEGVNFIICNTDAQAIANSKVPNKVQLGPHLTQGLGAGANPEIGRQATEESLEEIRRILEVNTKMAFITAGMGGGTGTGGAPIIAKICKDLGILTVGIVTTPFGYEGKKRFHQAYEGIERLKQYVDTLLVISNDKLRNQFGNLKMKEAFSRADNVLATAAKCITDVINSTGQINVDFADVCTVMKNGGVAILGNASVGGENRAQRAIEEAVSSPLLNDNDIRGAKWILININSSEGDFEHTMDEVEIIQNHLLDLAGEHTDVILGMGYDNTLGDKIGITLIATGFDSKEQSKNALSEFKKSNEPEKILMDLQPAEVPKDYVEPVLEQKPETESSPVEIVVETEAAVILEEPVSKTETIFDEPLQSEISGEEDIQTAFDEPAVQWEIQETVVDEQLPVTFDVSPVNEEEVSIELPLNESVTEQFSLEEAEESVAVTPVSAGYLTKPTVIYEESESEELSEEISETILEKIQTPDVKSAVVVEFSIDETDEIDETPSLELIEKSSDVEFINEPVSFQFDQEEITLNTRNTAITDEGEEQRKKAAERLHKLRNLSFNYNSADPNNEFETVPAYVRKNLELYNTISPAENFYSNYTIQSDDSNQVKVNTMNTFLEGKKPD